MIYKINEVKNFKLAEAYKSSMKELNSFFGINMKHNCPSIFLIPDRKTINELRKKQTEDWLVAWAEKGNVYLLDSKKFNTESGHIYSEEKYYALLKHELTHCFVAVISDFARKPTWLLEGVAIFLSGQTKLKIKPTQYKKFIEFYNKGGGEIYKEAGFAVEFLVKKYGRKKILLLLKKLKEVKSEKDFTKLFKSVYGFKLAYKNFKIL